MCGIVCYFGQSQGLEHVIEALTLLEYRAPDSSGVSLIDGEGNFSLARSEGTARQLVQHLVKHPLHERVDPPTSGMAAFLKNQGGQREPKDLRSCTVKEGFHIQDLYQPGGFTVGLGDRGALALEDDRSLDARFSAKVASIFNETDGFPTPDFDLDPVRHAFRQVAQHVVSQIELHPELQPKLTDKLQDRYPESSYEDWSEAWVEEIAWNIPGVAFATAVRHFQGTLPSLTDRLAGDQWGRFGGYTAQAMSHIVMGHGRWAMVGEVSAENTHPFLDRSRTRAVCENGSHNANLLLETRSQQERWWRDRGIPEDEPIHRSDNTTEVIAYEWERAFHQIKKGSLPSQERDFLNGLKDHGVEDHDELALRLSLSRLKRGNAHACSFHSLHHPGRLYISSHNKPIAMIRKAGSNGDQSPLMVASDVNAGLMLWTGPEVDGAAARINELYEKLAEVRSGRERIQKKIQSILNRFRVEVIFLDRDLYGGEELFARIYNQLEGGTVQRRIEITKYDGTPLDAEFQELKLNPSMVGKRGYSSYTEFHIAEIPDVLDRITTRYIREGKIHLESKSLDLEIYSPGLNESALQDRFGAHLDNLKRILLIGEGSSWRDAQAVSPFYRHLMPEINVESFHPVEVLNQAEAVNPESDLVLEISWSGTTDSVLKTDAWLNDQGVMRLGITGRPQSDVGRRTAESAGTLDVQSGVEISVATVKGFESILMTLYLIGLRLTEMRHLTPPDPLPTLQRELVRDVPRHVRGIIEDQNRRQRIFEAADRCSQYNKVAVVGDSPICIEGELKIEELAQIVACPFDFSDGSLRSLMDRSSSVEEDRQRTLFLINATTPESINLARPLLDDLRSLGVFFLLHTVDIDGTQGWEGPPVCEVFSSPKTSAHFQPIIDALFFFDFAVALAYARDLSAREIDRPRNLAKSVTTTGAEERKQVEERQEFNNLTLDEFSQAGSQLRGETPHALPGHPTAATLQGALSPLGHSRPGTLQVKAGEKLQFTAESEALEHAALMAQSTWEALLDLDVDVTRQTESKLEGRPHDIKTIHLQRSGSVPALQDDQVISFPADYSPLDVELSGALYLMSCAVRLARAAGIETDTWETALTRLPPLLSHLMMDERRVYKITQVLRPYLQQGYDKAQVIGGGQDYAAAKAVARSLRSAGFMAEALYTDSAWHGPLAAVGGPGADRDALVFIFATDPLFQPAAMVDTQVYRTRHAPVILILPEGNQDLAAVKGVDATAVLTVPQLPRPFTPLENGALGSMIANIMGRLWSEGRT